jgi:hypothetical protein
VRALARSGGTVYVGGQFSTLGGASRSYVGAVDATTGSVTSWNPGANGDVYALLASGETLYAGGFFSTIAGQSRGSIASFDIASGGIHNWNPNANHVVAAMSLRGTTLYIGGYFTEVAGQPRSYIAAVDAAGSGAPIPTWTPDADQPVLALTTTQRIVAPPTITVYAAGQFTTIAGQGRNHIAAIDGTTGAATTWNPDASAPVNAVAVQTSLSTGSATTIYAGGEFQSIGGQPRSNIAALNAAGVATSWNPGANGHVLAMARGSENPAGAWLRSTPRAAH